MNELQQILNTIELDKNTNLRSDTLKEGITCLGVDGSIYAATPIYNAVNYTYKQLSLDYYLHFVYTINKFTLIVSDSTDYGYYDGKLVGSVSINRQGYVFCSVVKITETYVILAQGTSINGSDRKCRIVKLTQNDISILSESIVIPFNQQYIDNCLISKSNTIFIGSDNNNIYRFDESTISFKNYGSTQSMDVSNSYICGDIVLSINSNASTSSDSYITKATYNEQEDTYTYIQQTSKGSNGFLYCVNGINWYGNKLFKAGNIYQLNADLTMGNLIKENAYTMSNYASNKLYCINDKYYYNGDTTKLYLFDEDTNTFTECETPVDFAYQINLNTCRDIYLRGTSNNSILNFLDFIYGETLIGYSFNGITVSNSNLIFNSENILSGNTFYTNQLQPVLGTMTNNGDIEITPTTSNQNKSKGYYNSITVNAVTSSIDENIKPENIKKGVTILGVTGTYEGIITEDEYNQALNTTRQILGVENQE